MSHTLQGWIHLAAATLALVLGFPQFARRQGDILHRRLGYAYVAALSACDVTALTVYHFTGTLNFLHIGAIVSGLCLVRGMVPLYRQPRSGTALMMHARWLTGSYIGVWAAGLTELVVRTVTWTSRVQIVVVTIFITVAVTVAGRIARKRLATNPLLRGARADT